MIFFLFSLFAFLLSPDVAKKQNKQFVGAPSSSLLPNELIPPDDVLEQNFVMFSTKEIRRESWIGDK